MTTVARTPNGSIHPFRPVAESFLQQKGLPFAEVLPADDIAQVFADHGALFAEDDIYATPLVLWAFLAQALRDRKGNSCTRAVHDIRTHQVQVGGAVPSPNTGDYCRARAKLNLDALRQLARLVAGCLEQQAKAEWLWHALHPKLADGTTLTMPDTPDNQQAFPQPNTQEPGIGFPIARICAVLSLATGCIHDLAMGPYQGKETGETALFRTLLENFGPGDIAVADRYMGSYMTVALLALRGAHACVRLHQARREEVQIVQNLGPGDRLVQWPRPTRPDWMSEELYARIPQTLTLRQVTFDVTDPGCRSETITVVTTLLDAETYPAEDIAELFGFRWNVEVDLLQIKQTLGLDHLRCKSPEMVQREVWVALLAYNLVRKVIATAAVVHDRQPRELSFTGACDAILSSWMLLATGSCRHPAELWRIALQGIAANVVANRPGRIEPRVLKRRRHGYPLMTRPRAQLRAELCKT